MTLIIIYWLALTIVEAARNWYIIVRKQRSPNHKKAWLLRVVAGIIFWILTPIIYHDLPYDSWWAMPMMMGFTFWWSFDIVLNMMRRRPIWYLGDPADPEEDSWMDSAQQKSFGALPWFCFKLLLAGASITIFCYGLNAVFGNG